MFKSKALVKPPRKSGARVSERGSRKGARTDQFTDRVVNEGSGPFRKKCVLGHPCTPTGVIGI
jgi:hypothetical protein